MNKHLSITRIRLTSAVLLAVMAASVPVVQAEVLDLTFTKIADTNTLIPGKAANFGSNRTSVQKVS